MKLMKVSQLLSPETALSNSGVDNDVDDIDDDDDDDIDDSHHNRHYSMTTEIISLIIKFLSLYCRCKNCP